MIRAPGARPGDALLLTKGIAVEGTAIIARENNGLAGLDRFFSNNDSDENPYTFVIQGTGTTGAVPVGSHTGPAIPLALSWPWVLLVAAVATGAIAALALKRRAA